jgi:hypothetical protein
MGIVVNLKQDLLRRITVEEGIIVIVISDGNSRFTF